MGVTEILRMIQFVIRNNSQFDEFPFVLNLIIWMFRHKCILLMTSILKIVFIYTSNVLNRVCNLYIDFC
jgi:hypothetical protein